MCRPWNLVLLLLLFCRPTDMKKFSRLPVQQKIKLPLPYRFSHIRIEWVKDMLVIKFFQHRLSFLTKCDKMCNFYQTLVINREISIINREISIINPSHPDPGRREKFNLNFYFYTSLWCLKWFYEGLEGLHKTLWGTTKKYGNRNLS